MQTWLKPLAVLTLSFVGFLLGRRASRLRRRNFCAAYAFPLLALVMLVLTSYSSRLHFVVPFSYLAVGRTECAVMSFLVPMLFGTLLPLITKRRLRILLSILLAVALIHFVIIPFWGPLLVRNKFEKSQTLLTDDGICAQSTSYTCGPAAAVTALKQFGINAQEGEVAILAHTAPLYGTADDLLSQAIQKRYGSEGISCHYRRFDSIAQLKNTCPTIAVVKLNLFADHYVTVLKVTDDHVVIADPLVGRKTLTYGEFEGKWRFLGIIIQRNNKADPKSFGPNSLKDLPKVEELKKPPA